MRSNWDFSCVKCYTKQKTRFEGGSYLRRNDSLAQKYAISSGNKWKEAMKGVPSYYKHMRKVETRTAGNQNAFNQVSEKHDAAQSQTNAI